MYNRKEWLANHVAEKHMVGVELGVLRGPTFKYLIENCPNLTLTGVDVFTPDWLWKARKIFYSVFDVPLNNVSDTAILQDNFFLLGLLFADTLTHFDLRHEKLHIPYPPFHE